MLVHLFFQFFLLSSVFQSPSQLSQVTHSYATIAHTAVGLTTEGTLDDANVLGEHFIFIQKHRVLPTILRNRKTQLNHCSNRQKNKRKNSSQLLQVEPSIHHRANHQQQVDTQSRLRQISRIQHKKLIPHPQLPTNHHILDHHQQNPHSLYHPNHHKFLRFNTKRNRTGHIQYRSEYQINAF